MVNMKKIFLTISLFFVGLLVPLLVFANNSVANQVKAQLEVGAEHADFGTAQDPRSVIEGLITITLSLMGSIFLILVVLGAYHIFTAGGDQSKVDKGKSYMRNATIGLVIVLMSYSITLFVGMRVQEAVAPGSTDGGIDPSQRVMCCDLIWDGALLDRAESLVVDRREDCTKICDGSDGSPDTCLVSTLSKPECLRK
jgi:hypothetical protein